MSSCWSVLGIQPTPVVVDIKRAYVRLLKITKPDEDPKGFMRLRKAYEDALKEARYLSPDEIPDQNTNEPTAEQKKKIIEIVTKNLEETEDTAEKQQEISEPSPTEPRDTIKITSERHLTEEEIISEQQKTADAAPEQQPSNQLVFKITDIHTPEVNTIPELIQAWVKLYEDRKLVWNFSAWNQLLNASIFDNLELSHQAYAQLIFLFTQNPFAPSKLFPLLAEKSGFYESYQSWKKLLPPGVAEGFHQTVHSSCFQLPNENLEFFPGDEEQLKKIVGLRRELEDAYIKHTLFNSNIRLDDLQNLIDSILALWPVDYEVLYLAGRWFWSSHEGERAYQALSAIDLTKVQDTSLKKEIALQRFEVAQRLQKSDLNLLVAELLDLDENNLHALKYLARQHFAEGRHEEALSLLGDLLKVTPVDFELRTLSTQIRLHYLNCLFKPEDRLRTVEILYELKRYDECISLYSKYSYDFLHAGSLCRALCYLEKNDTSAAFQDFDNLCRFLTDDKQNIGELVKDIGFHGSRCLTKEWIREYALPNFHYLTLSQHRHYSYPLAAALIAFKYSTLLRNEDEKEHWLSQAEVYGRKALQLNPTDDYVNFQLGNIFIEAKNFNDAITCYKQCAATYQSRFALHENLAKCYRQVRRFAEAIDCHRRSFTMSVNKQHQTYHLKQIISLYEELNDHDSAKACRDELEELERNQ